MSQDTFPQNNLSPSAVPWARKIQEVTRRDTYRIDALEMAQQADNRGQAGQMGVVGRQIEELTHQQGLIQFQQGEIQAQVEELSARATHTALPADLELIRGASAGSSGPVSRGIPLPGPTGGQRAAILNGSGRIAWTGTIVTGAVIGDSVTVGLEVRQGGTRVWYTNSTATSLQLFPWMGSDTFAVSIPVVIPSGGSTFDIRMWVGRTSSGGQTNAGARLEGMNFTLTYGDRV